MRFLAWTLLLPLFVIPQSLCGQQKSEQLPLSTVLSNIQGQYGYRFNYAPETIANLFSEMPQEGATLNEILQHLKRETRLEFKVLSDNFISIKPGESTICGILKDAISQKPVEYAMIWSGNHHTVSDESGFFELPTTADQQINIHHLSYQAAKLTPNLSTSDCQEVTLQLKPQILPEIVLSGFMVNGIDKLNNGAFKIDFEEFTILPGLTESDVLQSVQAFPGILSVNETVSNINIRGGSHDQNLIRWDGIKMYQSGHFFGLISLYNPQITQSVALRKNGSPANSTDGVSGTIDMNTAEDVNQQLKGNVGVNFINADAFLDLPLSRKSSVQLAIRQSFSDLVKTPTYSEYFDRIFQDTEVESGNSGTVNSDKNFDFYDGSLRWIYKPSEDDEIRVNFLFARNDLYFNENALVEGRELSRESSLDQISIAGGVSYHKSWSQRFNTHLNIYESHYQRQAVNADILEDQRFLQENEVAETGVTLSGNYKVNDQLQWNSGYHFVETKVTNLDDVDNPLFRRLEAEVVRAHGLFSEIGLVSKSGQTSLNLGGRVNYLEKFEKFIIEPRLSFNHGFSRWWNFEILGEFKHQFTSQVINFQNDFLGIENRRWQLSDNDSIPIITSKQVSTGISFTKDGWLLNGEIFYKSVDGISSRSQGFQNQFEFFRTSGSYISKGLDLLIKKQVSRVHAWMSYSYLESDYTFEDLEFTTFPNQFDIRHALSIGTTYNRYPLLVSAGLNWRSGAPTTRPLSVSNDFIEYMEPNSARLNHYLRVDLSTTYQLETGENTYLLFGLSVWNLLNSENQINSFYRLNEDGQPEEVIQESLGLTPNLSVRFYF